MRCVRALLAFFTAIPVKAHQLDFSCAWALPYVVAPVVGGVGAAVYAVTGSGLVAYLALLLATGLHHLDGLADSADALMVRDRERARAVLEDPRRGTAGVFAVATAVALASAAEPYNPLTYITAELFSKSLAVVVAGNSKPFKTGLGAAFIEAARGKWILTLPALAVSTWLNPAVAAVATVPSLLIYVALYKHLGGANGDVFGALLEVSRLAYLYAAAHLP